MNKKNKHRLILMAMGLILAICGGVIIFGTSNKTKKNYVTLNITRGDISYTVSATGEIRPLNTVNIGSQVSGTISKILVDYNSQVKKGDVLLEIDPTVLKSQVEEAKASLISAQSQMEYAKSEYKRSQELAEYIARAEIEKAKTTYEQAQQTVNKMQYAYDRAVTNLGYATITSPVDGTVVSRKVDEGQTVAASFQTPDLFEIAEDLTKMQIETSVSEADIGVIKTGQDVKFTVDAYPKDTFVGTVRQVRLAPTTTSNVVVYTVVIDVNNSDMRLLPGMTAFVTVIVEKAEDVWKAQNAAFLVRSFDGLVPDINPEIKPETHLAIKRGNDVVFVKYSKGLESATETQIISDEIQAGDQVIVGYQGQTANKKSANKRNANRGGPGGPMRM